MTEKNGLVVVMLPMSAVKAYASDHGANTMPETLAVIAACKRALMPAAPEEHILDYLRGTNPAVVRWMEYVIANGWEPE